MITIFIMTARGLQGLVPVGIVFGLLFLLFSPSDSNADMPMGGLQQRIGNYDVSVKTDPPQPQTGATVKILMAIAAINGDDISGIPVDITIKDDGNVLSGLNRPIAVPYGHYTYQYRIRKTWRLQFGCGHL